MKKIQNGLFYTALTIELLILLIDKSALVNPLEGRLFQITFLLFAGKVFLTKYTNREWIIIFLFEILGLISYQITGRNEIIRIVTLIAACKDMDMRMVFRFIFRVTLIGCILIVVLSLGGILGTVSLTGVFRGNEVETRYCLGMGHPNSLHCMFLMLILLAVYLYGEKMKVYQSVLLFLGNIGLFFLTGSKTGTMVTAFAIMFGVIIKYCKKIRQTRLFFAGSSLILAFCTFIAWWAAKYSEILPYHEEMRRFDRLLSDRIVNLYYDSASHAGTLPTWTMWGVLENEYFFDLGWVRLFYWYGVIPGCLFVIILFLLIWQMRKKNDYQGIVMLTSLCIYTLVEAHIISVYIARDYTLFLIGTYWCGIFHADVGAEYYFWKLPKQLKQSSIRTYSEEVQNEHK